MNRLYGVRVNGTQEIVTQTQEKLNCTQDQNFQKKNKMNDAKELVTST